MSCKKCNREHDGSYGSGAFCSSSCARSYSTSKKRKEINAKISATLSGKNKCSESDIIEAIESSITISEASKKLNISYNTLKKRVKDMGIRDRLKPREIKTRICSRCNNKEITKGNISGFCQECYNKSEDERKVNLWLKTGNTSNIPGANIRNGIREYIYKEQHYKCDICHINRIWNNKKLNFILDHIDGDIFNNFRENLRLICPNCDSQLDTFKSKNKKLGRSYRRKR